MLKVIIRVGISQKSQSGAKLSSKENFGVLRKS